MQKIQDDCICKWHNFVLVECIDDCVEALYCIPFPTTTSCTNPQTGPKHWSKSINPENICWKEIFQSVHRTCVENKLGEFCFKFIHRIIVTKKELFRFTNCKIKEDSDCMYCGEEDCIDHSFISCQFTVSFAQKVLQWLNTTHNSVFNLNTEEFLFGLSTVPDVLQKKIKLHFTVFALLHFVKENSRMIHY